MNGEWLVFSFFFFFSSRRRHTRFDCDWSSDVCSSDLHYTALESPNQLSQAAGGVGPGGGDTDLSTAPQANASGIHNVYVASQDRKSTRLNSSHSQISYAVFCLKTKIAA